MKSRVHSVAILATNKAFSAILAGLLEAERGYRVPCFSEVAALETFLVISPVDVVVLDADAEDGRNLAPHLRRHPKLANPFVHIVALTRAYPAFHRPLLSAGADIVLQKPVGPGRLLTAIDGLLMGEQRSVVNWAGPAPAPSVPPNQASSFPTANVVQLFPRGRD